MTQKERKQIAKTLTEAMETTRSEGPVNCYPVIVMSIEDVNKYNKIHPIINIGILDGKARSE